MHAIKKVMREGLIKVTKVTITQPYQKNLLQVITARLEGLLIGFTAKKLEAYSSFFLHQMIKSMMMGKFIPEQTLKP